MSAAVDEPTTGSPASLPYGTPGTAAPSYSVWSLIGVALALSAAALAAKQWWGIWPRLGAWAYKGDSTLRGGLFLILPAIALALCVVGFMRDGRRLGLAGAVVAAVALTALVVLAKGFPWL